LNHWKELVVWRKSHELVLLVYKVVGIFPKNEQYALADQIKRAAASVPANIVEGYCSFLLIHSYPLSMNDEKFRAWS
jgi:hypothetical protein